MSFNNKRYIFIGELKLIGIIEEPYFSSSEMKIYMAFTIKRLPSSNMFIGKSSSLSPFSLTSHQSHLINEFCSLRNLNTKIQIPSHML